MGWVLREELDERQLDDLVRLSESEGAWWMRGRARSELAQIVAGSDVVVALCDAETTELVGFARALTDGARKALILDVVVSPDRRGQGLGRALMDALCAHRKLRDVRDLELYCLPEMVPFYERHGFTTDVGSVLLMRRRR